LRLGSLPVPHRRRGGGRSARSSLWRSGVYQPGGRIRPKAVRQPGKLTARKLTFRDPGVPVSCEPGEQPRACRTIAGETRNGRGRRRSLFRSLPPPTPRGRKNVIVHEADYTKYKKLAVWFGNEGVGISGLALEQSELCVNIPMFGIIESLNLGTSSGIVLYEITKQRRAFQEKLKARIAAKKNRNLQII
jgi:SpoU rRNA Methylase family